LRLDKLTIGSPKDSHTHQFKNLKDVTIAFDQEHWVTVVIGWNGTGKSNVLEALATIFRDLIGKKRTPAFAFKLVYRMGSGDGTQHIHIDADPDREKDTYLIHITSADDQSQLDEPQTLFALDEVEGQPLGKQIRFSTFIAEDSPYLPRYIFSYYSGESTRMHEVYRPYLESYDSKLRNGENPGLKRLFYALPVHSQFVLLAFLIQQNDTMRDFLENHLGLNPDEGIESVLFVLRQPPWKSKAADGDPRFWNARGVVRDFLDRLYHIALAPIRLKRRMATTLWNKGNLEFLYLYVKDIEALRRLVGHQPSAEFFRDLESTYVSELIDEVRIRVKLSKNDESVTFRELSEGEQQLLTVLGLLRFTAGEESLFLLDEPDTHLNPRWSVDYLTYLKEFVGKERKNQETSHIVLTTHNPLSIAELVKEQVQILKRAEQSHSIEAQQPEFDPRGMGYAGIITSDMFGLAAALDTHTQELLEEKRQLSLKETPLTPDERARLEQINLELDGYGFRYTMRDPLFEEYLRARFRFDEAQPPKKKLVKLPSAERRAKARKLIEIAAQKVKKEGEESSDA
jgi:predicted ATPase